MGCESRPAMTTTHPDSRAPATIAGADLPRSAPAPSAAHTQRIARLRGQDVYQRKATPAEIEADLSALRGLEAAGVPLRKLTLTVAVGAGIATPILALISGAASSSAGGFVAAALLGITVVVTALVMRSRVAALARDKIEAASSLLRRLDVAAGAEVSMALILRPGDGTRVADRKVHSDHWRGSHSFAEDWEDRWLSLEAPLSNGAAVLIARTAIAAKQISVQSRGTNGSVTTTRTSRGFRDRVAVRYDPAHNHPLAAASTTAASALRLGPDTRIAAFENQPGSLDVTVSRGPRADGSNLAAEIADLVAQVVHLALPQRCVVLTDREAWGPNTEAEAEATRAGGTAQIAALRGASIYAGAGVLALVGLVLLYVASKDFTHAGWAADSVERARASAVEAKASIAKAKTTSARESAQARLFDAQRTITRESDTEAEEMRSGFLHGALGLVFLIGPPTGLVLRRRRRART